MGASGGGYRCRVAEIRDATPDDFDAVFELLDVRSRAALGTVVQEHERGRGLGKASIHHGFREYAARSVGGVGVKVDSTNPTGAPQLYERLGFVIDQRLGIWAKAL